MEAFFSSDSSSHSSEASQASAVAQRSAWVKSLEAIAKFSREPDRAWGPTAPPFDGVITSELPDWMYWPIIELQQAVTVVGVVATAHDLSKEISGPTFTMIGRLITLPLLDALMTKYADAPGVQVPKWGSRPDRVLRGLGAELLFMQARLTNPVYWQVARAFPPSALATTLDPNTAQYWVNVGMQEYRNFQSEVVPS